MYRNRMCKAFPTLLSGKEIFSTFLHLISTLSTKLNQKTSQSVNITKFKHLVDIMTTEHV